MDYVQPTNDEKRAVRAYCVGHANITKESAPYAKRKRELSAQKKQLRDAMLAQLLASGVECACLRPAQTADASPSYVRVKTYSNQTSLSPELVADALDELDALPDDADELRSALLESIKEKRLVTKRYADISATVPKGAQPPIPEASAELAQTCEQYRAVVDELAALEKELKEKLEPLKREVSAHEASVAGFMARANIGSQRVNVASDGCAQTYFIRRKRSEKRPRVTNATLDTIIARSIANLDVADAHFRTRFRDTVAQGFDQLPTETKERLSLDRGALKREREEAAEGPEADL